MEIQTPTQGTTFNLGVNTTFRIHNLLEALNHSKVEGNILLSRNILMALYDELYPFLTPQEISIGDKHLEAVEKSFKYSRTIDTVYFEPEAINLTKTLNRFISEKLNEKGLLMPKSQRPEEAIYG